MALEDVLKKYKDFINIDTPKYYLPSSLLSINMLTGDLRGLLSGRVVQILGDKGTGKSSLCLDIIGNAQKSGFTCAYIDFERTYMPSHAEILGVDTKDLILVKPETAEIGLEISEELIKADVKVIVIDSIAVMQASSELEKKMTDNEKMASTASVLTRYLKRVTPLADNYGALVLMVNQYRANISTLSRKAYKPFGPEIMAYGNSLTFELTRIKNGEHEAIVEAFVEKNKLAGTERRKTEYTLIHGKGFDIEGDILKLALEYDIISRKGAWYNYKDLKAQGLEGCKEVFNLNTIKEEVIRAYRKDI